MEDLIVDDRTSPDQIIRAAVGRRRIEDRRCSPYSGMVGREFDRRKGPKTRRIEVRQRRANLEPIKEEEMEDLIVDDRTSPDQTIRAAVGRRHIEDRRCNPYSGMVEREFERRKGPQTRRISVRQRRANLESISGSPSGVSIVRSL